MMTELFTTYCKSKSLLHFLMPFHNSFPSESFVSQVFNVFKINLFFVKGHILTILSFPIFQNYKSFRLGKL